MPLTKRACRLHRKRCLSGSGSAVPGLSSTPCSAAEAGISHTAVSKTGPCARRDPGHLPQEAWPWGEWNPGSWGAGSE